MARPSNTLREAVHLFVAGPPHLVGQWDRCCIAAGMRQTPDQSDPMVSRLILAAHKEKALEPRAVPAGAGPGAALGTLEKVAAGLDAEGDGSIDWKAIRSVLSDTIQSIATGETRPTAAQVAMIKYITEKAELQAKVESTTHSVVVLPTQGTGAEMKIDAEWMRRIQRLEKEPDAQG